MTVLIFFWMGSNWKHVLRLNHLSSQCESCWKLQETVWSYGCSMGGCTIWSRSPMCRVTQKRKGKSFALHVFPFFNQICCFFILIYNEFIRCFRQFVSLIFFSLSSWKKILFVQNSFFCSVCQFKRLQVIIKKMQISDEFIIFHPSTFWLCWLLLKKPGIPYNVSILLGINNIFQEVIHV